MTAARASVIAADIRARVAAPVLVVAAVVAAFSPALSAGFVNWDDPGLLLENPHFRGLDAARLRWMLASFHMGHWHPLTWLTFALDHALWGMDPRGYHLTNLALHALTALFVYALARRLFAVAGAGEPARTLSAAVAALLFAVHPLRVESVAWVTERRDVVSAPLLVLAVLAWLRFAERGGRARYAASLVAFALSLLGKAWGITLPAILLLLDAWPLRRLGRVPVARLVAEKAPFVALAGAAAAIAYVAQRSAGAMADAAPLGWLQRAMQALYGLAFYVRKSVVPTRLSPIYLLDPALDPAAPRYVASAVAVVVALAGLWALRRRWPAATAAVVAYAILVSPVLGLAQSGVQIVADRYSYVACIPLALLAGGALTVLPASVRRVAGPVAVVAIVALGLATWRQTRIWHDSLALWNHALALDPDDWLAHNSRGRAYEDAGDAARAAGDFDAAIRLAPGYVMAWVNRGHVRASQGDIAGALDDWNHALALAPGHPDALMNRGGARLVQGDVAGGVADLETATRLRPGSASAWYNLATGHAMLGRVDLAIADIRHVLEAVPPDDELHARAERKLAALRALPGG